MKARIKLYLTICLYIPVLLFSQQKFLHTPISGNYMQDFYLVNYVDWSIDSILDHKCGSKTYDGHQGTDFVLRNFVQMDAGVSVLAAADGIVTSIADTLFDRNKTAISGGLGNYIAIRHSNNYYSYYGHLKKHSVLVKPGDSVKAGQLLAEVGSSGYASDPHLHFELWYDSLYVVDPFAGSCGNASSLWMTELPYVNSFGIIDHDFCNFETTLDTLKEKIPSQKKYTIADDKVNFWMQGFGVRKGDISKVNWYTPQHDLWYSFQYTHPSDIWYYYFWTYISRPPVSMPGKWTAEYLVNDHLKFIDTFELNIATYTKNNDDDFDFSLGNTGEIQFSKKVQSKSTIVLCNALGEELYSLSINPGGQDIILPIYNYKPGIYILVISNSSYRKSYKFIKN